MSVIFKSLKKMKDEESGDADGLDRFERRSDVYTFKKIFFSPVVLIVIALIGAIGYLGVIYGMTVLEETPSKPARRASTIAPPPPAAVPVEEQKPPPGPLGDWQESLPGDVSRYMAPGSQTPGSRSAGFPRPGSSSSTADGPRAGVYTPPAGPTTRSGTRTAPADSEPSGVDQDRPRVIVHDDQPAPESIPVLSGDERELPRVRVTTSRGGVGRREGGPPQALSGGGKIGRLAEDLKAALNKKDGRRVEELLDRLEGLKGQGDPYVLKLRAFWELRQGDYLSAGSHLKRVLAKDKNDVEAGVNMAILEIKTNRLQDARRRLLRLKELYPDDNLITDLLKKIQ